MVDKEAKSQRIKEMKEKWLSEDFLDDFAQMFEEDLDWFEKHFPDEKSCKRQLRFWLWWKKNEAGVVFKCPKCGGTDATTALKKEKKNRYVFRCKKCKHTPSPQAATIMTGSRSPLRFWFLCIYVLGLTNGKVPWSYLNKIRIDFVGGNDPKTIQARGVANILYIILEACQCVKNRMSYCRLVCTRDNDHEAYETYSHWYNSESWISWRIAFQEHSLTKKLVTNLISFDNYEKGVLAACFLKERNVQKYEWLLLARIKNNGEISSLRWMYVSVIEKIVNKKSKVYKAGYRYLAIQKNNDPIENDQPFIAGARFKKAFLRRWKQTKFDKTLIGSVKDLPEEWLEKIDSFMKKEKSV